MTQIITTHKNADFDAFASLVAATLIYPEAVAAIPKTVNPNVRAFMSIHKDVFDYADRWSIDTGRVTRLIVVDTADWARLGPIAKLKQITDLEVLVWDHHVGGDIDAAWKCQEAVGATVTLMVRQLKTMRKLITPIQATLFLAGLYEDTGNLTFSSCTAEDAYAAGWLLDRKADLALVNRFLRPAYGEKQKDVLFEMLQYTNRLNINGYSVSICRIFIDGHVGNLAVVVRMYREIVNVDAAFGLFVSKEKKSDRQKCMVIGRSGNDGLDVGTLMKSLGGGGHPGAGSAMLKSVNPEIVEQMIVDLIQGNQQSSVQISDLMSFPVFSVPSDTSMAEVAKILRQRGCTGLPVVDGGVLVGIISRRDFKKIRKQDQLQAPVKAFMSTRVISIEPGNSPIQAAQMMVRHDIGRLPVVEDGRIIGIITRSDVMMYFYDLLPDCPQSKN
ncbi:CBS domain-containing protein [Desulfosarcina sp.]|uniref:CBS domain-containing protein n=1 Tax=Desulfosarcina sp. TaxID=2027861 RepID=UPI0029BF70D5|nr:CBS domain-containing protein [Desulfosarcina sp.]MDX2453950.1 CBS domain-containing protein [Desulfosarcina sp.]MDX2491644.1 CBS domain-containing protein [Desulfosarcina sp.]